LSQKEIIMTRKTLELIHNFGRKIFLAAVILCVLSAFSKAQQVTSVYLYDDNGRLIAVINPNGDAFIYEYDAAGNFMGISNSSAGNLRIITFFPRRGAIGTRVTIYGTGFNAGVTGVTFNGANAQIIQANSTTIVAEVPINATTGPITVFTNAGSVTSTTSFVVKGVLILPHAITVSANDTVPFNANVSGLPTTGVIWSVNGNIGGSSAVGTITPNGLYMAPNLVNSPPLQYLVRATSSDDSTLFDEAVVTVLSAGEGYQFRTDGVSVRYGTPPNTAPVYAQNEVSARYGTPPNTSPVYSQDAVSVRYGTPPNTLSVFTNNEVSVRYGATSDSLSVFSNDAVSVGSGPYLISSAPGVVSRGSSITLNLSGVLLNNASDIRFFRTSNGTNEAGMTISNINVNGQGTSLTATLTVNANVVVGQFVIVVVTPSGATVRSSNNTNVIQVQ
jgi:YD repeat-containing protein